MKKRLTYANVTSTLALLVALTGGGVAVASSLPKNVVGSKQIKDAAVRTQDLADGAVTGAKVADGSLAGADVDTKTLAKVPSAAAADRATVAGTADRATTAGSAASVDSVVQLQRRVSSTDADVVLLTRGAVTVSLSCSGGVPQIKLSVSSGTLRYSATDDGSDETSNLGTDDGQVTVASGTLKRFDLDAVHTSGSALHLSGMLYQYLQEPPACLVDLVALG